MPIGASKVGALGGLVPGGSVTFNASGTWDVPPGVKIVSITGVGGAGNPGNSGTAGNPGNLGSGGSGGAGGQPNSNFGGEGGRALAGTGGVLQATVVNAAGPVPFACATPRPGQTGNSGQAGSAGSAGNPGNSGQPSSGLGNTFPGGAGGNAGNAGNAGTGGSGGQGGGGGSRCGPGGSGGNGGGSGAPQVTRNFLNYPQPVSNPQTRTFSGAGGGGAGATNDGVSGQIVNAFTGGQTGNGGCVRTHKSAPGGTTSNYSFAIACAPFVNICRPFIYSPTSWPPSMTGGIGAVSSSAPRNGPGVSGSGGAGSAIGGPQTVDLRYNTFQPNAWFCPYPLANPASQALRSGGGGGTGGNAVVSGGGGGGGGRGNVGNAGGAGGAGGTGAAGTPQTFNCVPVTPGTPTPITVGTPGGQIVISWNPQ